MHSAIVHTIAPDFDLLDQDGKRHSLQEYRGKYVLLYFYPKDDTPGCTTQACDLQENLNVLAHAQVQVLGVSMDSVASHKKFALKHQLHFPLLADTKKTVIDAYDVWKKKTLFGRTFMGIKRESFLIDPTGVIIRHYTNVVPAEHVAAVRADMDRILSEAS